MKWFFFIIFNCISNNKCKNLNLAALLTISFNRHHYFVFYCDREFGQAIRSFDFVALITYLDICGIFLHLYLLWLCCLLGIWNWTIKNIMWYYTIGITMYIKYSVNNCLMTLWQWEENDCGKFSGMTFIKYENELEIFLVLILTRCMWFLN